MASSPPSPPLVWVIQGKSQHSAYLLETGNETCVIRWNTTNQTATVPTKAVSHTLTPRRRNRPVVDKDLDGNDENSENQSMDTNHGQTSASGKRKASPQRPHQQDDDDSGDEVQVLLTILPPTPKRPKLKVSESNIMGTEARRVSTSPQPQNKSLCESSPRDEAQSTPATDDPVLDSTDRQAPDDNESAAHSTGHQALDNNDSSGDPSNFSTDAVSGPSSRENDARSNPNVARHHEDYTSNGHDQAEPLYSFQSSAYVQNLAEICYTILNDARWRVQGRQQKRLLAWEHGEDLSAVHMLSKLYEPPKRKDAKACQCLLCREKENGEEDELVRLEDGQASADEQEAADSSLNIEEATIRALYLYCRLYYRKGPWFRLDKIYTSYYAPADADETDADNESQDESSNIARRSSLFEPLSSSSQLKIDLSSGKVSKTKDDILDNAAIEDGLSRVALMLQDVGHLHDTGLVRTFHDEEECGRTAGAVTPEGYGVLLRADERRAIVEKLGGRVKKEKKSSPTARDNIIWKQMCQQTSISFFPRSSTSEGTKSLLPVCRHVDDALLENLATAVVMAASRVDYVPKAILRPAVSDVKARIQTMGRSGLSQEPSSVSMSLKLREPPLLTLRRCARLFLCATSGPGDMRGDGTNAWRSLQDLDMTSIHPEVPLPTVIQPPGSYSWYRVLHPALSHSFGISSFPFIHAHQFLECDGSDDYDLIDMDEKTARMLQSQVFDTTDSFRLWELCVEIRAHVDYHLELHETLAYTARKKAREEDLENEGPTNEGGTKGDRRCGENVDFLELLTVGGRKSLVRKLVSLFGVSDHEGVDAISIDIERSISGLEALVESMKQGEDGSASGEIFQFDSERIVTIFSIVILHILVVRNRCITQDELVSRQSRPWLRHLWFEGILAYALWDCIPLLERKRFHELACSCLEVLLFGKLQNRDSCFASDEADTCDEHSDRTPLSELLVSRRTRGKAHERLMIDYAHLLKWKQKTAKPPSDTDDTKTAVKPQDVVRRVSSRVVGAVARAGSLPFSAVRSIARRMKRPLAKTLESLPCAEVEALGIRLENGDSTLAQDNDQESKKADKYIDWMPPTDFAVANALAGEETIVGKRCSYVGFEDDAVEAADPSSWNVEELAMKYYATGRLPANINAPSDKLAGGGWVGWHDEGGHVRALFRIICAHAILGIDSGCGKESKNILESLEQLTIHLTPYQGAPFDLHVGYSHKSCSVSTDDDDDADAPQDYTSVRSFFQRRRIQIDRFLSKLEGLTSQELSDFVYDSIVSRLGQGRVQDALVARDLKQVRTLSALAAGFGGQQLSAMFRCLLFDYRHYSGGLPDLLLMRALVDDDDNGDDTTTTNEKSLVAVGEWIGEEFSAESSMEKEAASRKSLLIDKDDEFLGCSKVGDSGGQASSRRWGRRGTKRMSSQGDGSTQGNGESCVDPLEKLPAKLVLRHNDSNIKVQCLFVEVKSENDRLDGRQEDWLNVLDRVGNARVCKFGRGKKRSSKEKTSTKATKKQCTE